MVHPLLQRQMQKLGLDPANAPAEWGALLERVSQRYAEADQERYRLERSITICSEEMSELNARLEDERDQLRTIFESAPVGMARSSTDGVILDCNPAYASMLGRTKDEIIGHSFSEWVHEEEQQEAESRSWLLDAPVAFQRRYRHRNGTIVFASVGVTTVHDGDDKPVFNVAVVSDRTQEKHLEVSLRLAQKLEAVGRLAAGIAHEINTPIQFVGDNLVFLQTSLARMLELRGRVRDLIAEPALADFERIVDELDISYIENEVPTAIAQSLGGIEHVSKIVQAMRFMSHSQRSDDVASIDLNATLRNVVTVATSETKYVADVMLDLGHVEPIAGFPTDLNQVFLNLVVNAAHAVADTGTRGSIRLQTRMDGDHVVVSISDTGTGISEDVREKIFDPFFTTKEVGRGTGQGLAIARTVIVGTHRGTISFDTRVGAGTTFVVRLPIARARRDAA